MKLSKGILSKPSIFVALGIGLALGLTVPAQAAPITFTTAQSPFDAGVNNQGYWSPTSANFSANVNYFIGFADGHEHRNFFSFDLTSLSGMATSATLTLIRGGSLPSNDNEASETLEFFDVSTDAVTLNNNNGTSQAIFDDLGGGLSYGSFAVAGSGSGTEVLMFVLNAQALIDINAASGFFSIGGSLTSNDGNDGLLTPSGAAVKLDITTGPVNPQPIPEPSTMLLMGSGLLVMGLYVWRRERVQQA